MLAPQVVDQTVQTIMGGNRSIVERAFDVVVNSDESLSFAVDMLGEIKSRMRNIEKERTAMVKPINDSVKNINAKFKTVTQPLEDAERALKPKVVAYQSKIERERREAAEAERKRIEAEKLAEAEAQAAIGNQEGADRLAKEASAVVVKPEETGRGGFTGTKTVVTKRWVFEVENLLMLANARPELIKTDDALINTAIRNGEREIPGLKIFQTESVSVRT